MDGIRARQGPPAPHPRIQRSFVDRTGETWFVVGKGESRGGYPPGGRSVAFEEALEKRARAQAPQPVAPPPPPIVGPSADDLKELVYRAVLRGLPSDASGEAGRPEAVGAGSARPATRRKPASYPRR